MSLSKHEKTFQDSFALKGTFLLVGAERGLKAMRMGEEGGERVTLQVLLRVVLADSKTRTKKDRL